MNTETILAERRDRLHDAQRELQQLEDEQSELQTQLRGYVKDEDEDAFDDYLNETHDVSICGIDIPASLAFKECDRAAYDQELANWTDSRELSEFEDYVDMEERDSELDDEIAELEDEIAELEDEIAELEDED